LLFKWCYGISKRDEEGLPTFLSLQFDFAAVTCNVPVGSVLVAGDYCLCSLAEHDVDVQSIRDCRAYLRNECWVRTFKNLVKNPDATVALGEMDFDDIMDWCKCFHVLRPIDPDCEGGPVDMAITHLHAMFEHNAIPMIPLEDLLDPNGPRLVSCTCPQYLHYCLCPHTFVTLLRRGIITGYPPTLNPVPLNERNPGRFPNAHPGQALNRND